MGRVYTCTICGMCESKYISLPANASPATQRDAEFLSSLRILNLLTGVTDAKERWSSDRATHIAYASSASKLSFIGFMLSRFQISKTVPRIPVDGLLRDDFAQYLVVGQPVHGSCLEILCSALQRAQTAWTFTGIALNVFTCLLARQTTAHDEMVAGRLAACLSAGQLPDAAELGFMVSCPMSIPEPPSRAEIVGSSGHCAAMVSKDPAHRQLRSPLFRLPAECQAEVLQYMGMASLVALRSTCRMAASMGGFWRALFLATYEWSPVPNTDWCAYYEICKGYRNNLRNRGRIERVCRLALQEFDSWNLQLDKESAVNAAAFLRGINYNSS